MVSNLRIYKKSKHVIEALMGACASLTTKSRVLYRNSKLVAITSDSCPHCKDVIDIFIKMNSKNPRIINIDLCDTCLTVEFKKQIGFRKAIPYIVYIRYIPNTNQIEWYCEYQGERKIEDIQRFYKRLSKEENPK